MRTALRLMTSMLRTIPGLAQDRTLPPDTNVVPLPPVAGRGVQIYRCQPHQSTTGWVLSGPEATLYTSTGPVGTHTAGPMWRWKDGSAVIGKLLVSQPSPEPGAVPWLLLAATPAMDSAPDGVLVGVVYVRRSDTHGGMPPATCDASHIGAIARVPYQAVYTFYKAPPRPPAPHTKAR